MNSKINLDRENYPSIQKTAERERPKQRDWKNAKKSQQTAYCKASYRANTHSESSKGKMSDIELNGEEMSDIESSDGDEMNNVEPSEGEMSCKELSVDFGEDCASHSCTEDRSNLEQESNSQYDYTCNDSLSRYFPPSIPHQPIDLPRKQKSQRKSRSAPSQTPPFKRPVEIDEFSLTPRSNSDKSKITEQPNKITSTIIQCVPMPCIDFLNSTYPNWKPSTLVATLAFRKMDMCDVQRIASNIKELPDKWRTISILMSVQLGESFPFECIVVFEKSK